MKVTRSLSAVFLCALLTLPVLAQVTTQQGQTNDYGSSGGNIEDHSNAFCCSGTLGALVSGGNNDYLILSNNHVLGRSGAAVVGEDVSQPGLIDSGCRPRRLVADFTAAPALGSSNVDAAVAALKSGTMNTTGKIVGISAIASTPASGVTPGLGVKKSGRTTGLTTGSVGSINTSVKVQYQRGCNSGKKFTVSYTNQVVINSSTFSAGGDSGSLIVTNESCARPVALLFAGSSSTTIGNPISQVLSRVSTALGRTVTIVGQCSTSGGTAQGTSAALGVSAMELDRADFAKRQHARRLMLDDAVQGVGVGAADDDSGEAVIVVYVEQGRVHKPIPNELDGVRTKVVRTDKIRANGWNESTGQSCRK